MPLLSQKRVSQTTRQDSYTSDLGGATNHSLSTYRDGSPRTGRTAYSSIDVRWGTQTTLLSSMRTNQSSSPRRPTHHTNKTRGPIQLIPSDFSDPTSLYSNLIIDGTEPVVSALRGLNTSRAATLRSVKSATHKLPSDHIVDHILPVAPTPLPSSYPLCTWEPSSCSSTGALSGTSTTTSSWADDATLTSLSASPPLLLFLSTPATPAQLPSSRPSSATFECRYTGNHPTTFGLKAAQAAQMARVGGRCTTYTLDRISSILVRYKGSSGPVARRAKRGRRHEVSSTIYSRFGKAVPTAINERLISCTKFIRVVLGSFPTRTPDTSIIEPLGCLWCIDTDASPDILGCTRPRRRQSRIGFNASPLGSQLLTPCDPTLVPPRSPAISILVSTKSSHNPCAPTPRLESPRVTFTATFVDDGEMPGVSLSPFARQVPPVLLESSAQSMLMGPPLVSRTQELPRRDENTCHPNAPLSEDSPCQGVRSPITIGANSSMYVDLLSPPTTIHEEEGAQSEDEDSTRRLLVLGEEDGDEVPQLFTSQEALPSTSGPGAKYHKGRRPPSHPHRSDPINTAGGCGVNGCTIQ